MPLRIVLLSALFFLLGLIPSYSSGQSDHDLEVPVDSLSPGNYLNLDRELDLDDLQFKARGTLLSLHTDWSVDTAPLIRQDSYNSIRVAHYRKIYRMYSNILTPEQNARLDQIIRTKYFMITARTLISEELRDPGGKDLFAAVFLNASVQKYLDLKSKQVTEIKGDFESLAKLTMKSKKELKKSIDQRFEQWQEDLDETLIAASRRKFRETLGDKHKFSEKVKRVLQFGYSAGPLCLVSNPGSSFGGEISTKDPIYFLANLDCSFNGEIEFNSLFQLLLDTEISKDLNLSTNQKKVVAELEKKWFDLHPFGGQVKTSNAFGLRPFVNRDPADDKDKDKFYQEILEILGPAKLRRFRQILNQMVIQFGWKEVPLAHPSWIKELELNEDDQKVFTEIHTSYRAKVKQLKKDSQSSLKKAKTETSSRIFSRLNEEQRKKIRDAFGE